MSVRSTVEVLKAARKRIEDPERWTQGVHARVKQRGAEVEPHSATATCWCAVGALCAEGVDPYGADDRSFGFLERAAEEMDGEHGWPPNLNDRGTRATAHKRVLAMYDRAIELAESESQKEGERV